MRRTLLNLFLLFAACGMSLTAQTQTPPPATAPPPAAAAPGAGAPQVHADLNQLMRGVLYPAANVVFAAQADDPVELAKSNNDPSMATDPIKAAFGGWPAIQNAALALAESANLLMLPGRKCTNGNPVPIADPVWTKYVQDLRELSMKAYAAAQAKSQEKIIEVSEPLANNCIGCRRRLRDRRTPVRCIPG